ncbi:MAG TPA: hypothetical protein VJL28_14765 [Gemmatimonadaceae bacterium]|nr:hypothetical protein [Gemmatimonadaceae bacterium]
MSASSPNTPAARLRARQIVLWTAFTALLVLGVILYFRYADRIVPLLDAVIER